MAGRVETLATIGRLKKQGFEAAERRERHRHSLGSATPRCTPRPEFPSHDRDVFPQCSARCAGPLLGGGLLGHVRCRRPPRRLAVALRPARCVARRRGGVGLGFPWRGACRRCRYPLAARAARAGAGDMGLDRQRVDRAGRGAVRSATQSRYSRAVRIAGHCRWQRGVDGQLPRLGVCRGAVLDSDRERRHNP